MTWLFGEDWGARSLDGVAPPDSPENRSAMLRVALTAFLGVAAVAAPSMLLLIAAGLPEEAHGSGLVVLTVYGFALIPALWLAFRSHALWPVHLFAVACDVMITLSALALGPQYSPFTASLCWVVLGIVVSVIAKPRAVVIHLVLVGLSYGVVVSVQDGNTAPAGRWLAVVGVVVISGSFVSNLVDRSRRLAEAARQAQDAEHAALGEAERARTALEDLNATLEARVIDQVDELGRLNGLRRFLSAPVADAVLSGDVSVLEPHRRLIAVFFCDLRGFTNFATGAEPEEVVDVLDDYYRVVGDVLRRYEATVGTFAGDGVMAYLGDPVPCEDAAGKAVAMALDLRNPMRRLIESWTRLGHPIGYGVGIAFGYATLGMIGFEGRNDYTALGSVVNLAARLCDGAADGEVLIDQRAYEAVRSTVEAELVEVTVKGMTDPVAAYRVAG